ncbi:hypothetical protein M878_41585 [Streptomyces roseochromogenus subsp. oscitans DS 12.976]|uniref:Uncharacterized protein n=1 Tax=Streptomyces roseochromogenus subsp. oscitans DS 12.976 TaxID=1352936 RepID=V6JIK7_STRRC|nr:hypothetical protein M878_41585 [Streptomyces roseochromogenus subsp. oscitans DS 12.976]
MLPADQNEPTVPGLRQQPCGGAPAGPLGRDDGGQRVVLGQAVGEHGVDAVQPLGYPDPAQGHGRVDDAVSPPVEGSATAASSLAGSPPESTVTTRWPPSQVVSTAPRSSRPAGERDEAISPVTSPITDVRRRRRPRATGAGR